MNWDWSEIRRRLAADNFRLSKMTGLAVLGLLLWGRLLLTNVPRTAVAVPDGAAGAARAASASSSEQDAASAARPVIIVNLRDRIDRDLFKPDLKAYPQAPAEIAPGDPKSDLQTSDQLVRQRVIEEAARQLKLQSTLMSSRPKALINGALLEPGQQVQGFEVLEVHARHVVLRKEGVVVNLDM